MSELGLTSINGISCLGKHIGLKKKKKDFTIIFSAKPLTAVAVFTTNAFKAAPILVSKKHLKKSKNCVKAIVANSGNANACTGLQGILDAEETCAIFANELKIKKEEVLVFSTGVIGTALPMDKIKQGLKKIKSQLGTTYVHEFNAAQAILTTDNKPKQVTVQQNGIKIACIAKGSGMINPNMATMLCFIATNAKLSVAELQKSLNLAANQSFNQLSVDGCQSTNDSVVLLSTQEKQIELENFQKLLTELCVKVSTKIAEDAEGAGKLMEVKVKNAKTQKQAALLAKAVVSSDLVKTAITGKTGLVGRILAALGSTFIKVNPAKVKLLINGQKIFSHNQFLKVDYFLFHKNMHKKCIQIEINLNQGKKESVALGCNLTKKYVEINTFYAPGVL
ncbi:MAG: bifunctional glutamate N-acetyltransferase/amino-acid acetyltransferase ArgJ [Candidatus Diapherotrites archaeon]|nr:bifunctional glutamate N-acetyltransferase/amino-acid acetyltransferase ArgJ [Candidatus Diapherotrites archaeon]